MSHPTEKTLQNWIYEVLLLWKQEDMGRKVSLKQIQELSVQIKDGIMSKLKRISAEPEET